jgi:hypothetical protein
MYKIYFIFVILVQQVEFFMYVWHMPELVTRMTGATLECVYVREGETLRVGTKLFDISVDLSRAFAQECPPISYFRIILREAVYVQRLMFDAGQHITTGALVALFSPSQHQDRDQPAERQVRIATAGIMYHGGMWTGSH